MDDSQSLRNPENDPAKVHNIFYNTAKFFSTISPFRYPPRLPHLLLKKNQPLRALLPELVPLVRLRPDHGGRDKAEVCRVAAGKEDCRQPGSIRHLIIQSP